MPDDKPGEKVAAQPVQSIPKPQPVSSPPPPNSPDAKNTKTVSEQRVEAEIHDIGDRIKKAEKWMIWLTGAIVFLTAGMLIVGILQWIVIRGQLHEMKSGGADTHELAVQAKTQSEQTKALAESAGHQADASKTIADQAKAQTEKMGESLSKTDKLILQATEQAKATNRLATAAGDQVAKLDAQVSETHALAKAAADQSATSYRALTANQRPWVYFETKISCPLTFDESGAHLCLDVTFRNLGGSTAVGAGFEIEMYRDPTPQVRKFLSPETNRLCQQARNGTLLSNAIFVGVPRTERWVVGTPAAEVERQRATTGLFFTQIIACVAYRSPVDDTVFFETSSNMSLTRERYIDDKGRPSAAIIPPNSVAIKDLILFQDPALGLSVK